MPDADFTLRISWAVQLAYPGEPVEVELRIPDHDDRIIHREATIPAAVAWAVSWLKGRGFGFDCDIDKHQRCEHRHIDLFARPLPPQWEGSP